MTDSARSPRIAIIGSGFSGLCLGIQLKRAGIDSFSILEKEDRLGGTWRDNSYPGACCDVPSMFYCFSFEQRSDWPRKWSPQAEILAYMDHCAQKYGLLPHLRLGTCVEGARFDSDAGVWRVRVSGGEELEVDYLVSGVGQLHRPHVPDLPGLGSFAGSWFHSSDWQHELDLQGKRVAVIGNAASAIQFIPEIAPMARQLSIFQRSANWMIPRGDRPYGEREQRLFAALPWLAKLQRFWIWARAELLLYPVIRGQAQMSGLLRKIALDNLHAQVSDPALRAALTPDYPICGKRVLISDDYYPALARENVRLVSEGIDHISETSIVTRDGEAHAADVIIAATGFDTTHFLAPMKLEGAEGALLDDSWRRGAEGYLGLTVSGFPNFFMMYGPNTNLGHNSILFMIECQTRYIIECIQELRRRGQQRIELRPEAMEAYNQRIQRDLAETAWARTDKSWYKNAAGRITNNWPYSTARYWWETRRVDWSAYRVDPHRVDPNPLGLPQESGAPREP